MRFDCVFFDSGGTLFGAAGGPDPTPEQVHRGRIDRVAAMLSGLGIPARGDDLRAAVLRGEQECPQRLGASCNFLRLMTAVLEQLGLAGRTEIAASFPAPARCSPGSPARGCTWG